MTPFHEGSVLGHLHEPEKSNGSGVVLTHGAGGNSGSALLVKIATAFSAEGFTLLRFDLPFRQRRPKGPPSPATALQDRLNIAEAVSAMRARGLKHVVAGGQSYGGRQTSMLAAEKPKCMDGLLLLSYPLHPPGKTQLRTAHFPAIQKPALFIQGTRDPFGTPQELRDAIALIPGKTELISVEGTGHDLKGGKFDVSGLVIEPFRKVFGT